MTVPTDLYRQFCLMVAMNVVVVKLLPEQTRVLNGQPGLCFMVDSWHYDVTKTKIIVHVRDYRYGEPGRPFQIWSMTLDRDCELVEGVTRARP